MEDITSALLQQLISSCPDCRMKDIDMQLIDCGSESVIVYRARLEGTSQTDSSSLISLIEDWVTTGPSFIVTGILMKVDSECAVVISSLSDGECTQTSTDSSPSSTSSSQASSDTPSTAIIGGVVAIVIALIVGVVIVIVSVLRVKAQQMREKMVIKEPEDQ